MSKYKETSIGMLLFYKEKGIINLPEMCLLAPESIGSNSPHYSGSLQGLGTVAEMYLPAFLNKASPTLRQHINRTLAGKMHIKQIIFFFLVR